jgi:hypothetical protein
MQEEPGDALLRPSSASLSLPDVAHECTTQHGAAASERRWFAMLGMIQAQQASHVQQLLHRAVPACCFMLQGDGWKLKPLENK